MMRRMIFYKIIPLLALLLISAGCGRLDAADYDIYDELPDTVADYIEPATEQDISSIQPAPRLAMLNITHDIFIHSVTFPRQYQIDGLIMAGVVPHHLTASTMISGFFSSAAAHADHYDMVIILAPNHLGGYGDFVLSYRDWDIGDGVFSNRAFTDDFMAVPRFNSAINHRRMEEDHSASVLIPYIHHYLPGAEVGVILISRTLDFDGTVDFTEWLYSWIAASGKNVLLVCSIDFSHFLTLQQATENDRITKEAILSGDLHRIHTFCDYYLDSPAAMNTFLMYLAKHNLTPQIIDHADASEFLGPGLDETTSYMVIVGVAE